MLPLPSHRSSLASIEVCRLGRIMASDVQAAELLGRELQTLAGLPLTAVLEAEGVHEFLQQLWTSFRHPGRQVCSELILLRPDGSRFVALVFTRVPPGKTTKRCLVSIAVPPPATALQEGRQLCDRLPYGVVWLDSQEQVVTCNPAFCALLGFLPAQLQYRGIGTLFFDWCSEAAMTAGLQQRAFRIQGARRDGVLLPVEAHLYAVDPQVHDSVYLLVVRDLRGQESLERRSLRMAELERQSVGRELHDALGQNLIGMAFLADELASNLTNESEVDPLRHAEMAQRLAQLCRETCGVARTLVRGLFPIGLTEGNLAEALRDLANFCSTTHNVDCRADCQSVNLHTDISAHLFRISQEATTNALKHSGCDKIEIVLRQTSEAVMLTIKDNGKGLSPADAQSLGNGLHSIRHRCGLIGARLALAQPAQGGTGVSVTLPIPTKLPPP